MDAKGFSAEDDLVLNGIDGATGGYLLPTVNAREVTAFAKGALQDREHLRDLERRHNQPASKSRGVREGVDPQDLSQAGWGILFAHQDQERAPAIMEALGDLLALRKSQAGERYKEFSGLGAYRPGESKTEFLARHGVGPGPADPDRVPYYLLIAADPEAIPYTFQYQVDVQYAVGRVYFDDLDGYAHYASSLVAMETGQAVLPRRAVFVGVQNEADQSTRLSATRLVEPLAAKMLELQKKSRWAVESLLGEAATKAALSAQLGATNVPALTFTASHGMGFPRDDPRQLPHQGALLCRDWPGPLAWREPIPEEFYYSADDVASDAQLAGSMAFHFACYGAGTPRLDDFSQRDFREPAAIAPHAFVARLPQSLLGHPNGGMAAVVGHVERAWGYSFLWEKTESQLAVFESTLQRVMNGYPIGYAMEYFNERYAELSTLLSSELQGVRFGKAVDELALAGMWTANNDARSYVILGDPAARLVVAPLDRSPGDLAKQAEPASILVDLHPSESSEAPLIMIDRLTRVLLSTRPDSPEWAERQFLLGSAFGALQRGDRRANLRIAVEAYQAASRVYTPERNLERWADLQGRLADQYIELYAWTGDLESARAAEQACRAVISATTGTGADLAAAHLRLADLYAGLYEHDQKEATAGQAIEAYQKALEVYSREQETFTWAMAHFALARLEASLYRNTNGDHHRVRALDDLQAALEVLNKEIFPYQYAGAQALQGELS